MCYKWNITKLSLLWSSIEIFAFNFLSTFKLLSYQSFIFKNIEIKIECFFNSNGRNDCSKIISEARIIYCSLKYQRNCLLGI